MDKNLGQPARSLKADITSSGESQPYTNDDIGIDLLVNARGRACMLHDKPFLGTPVWIKYLTNQRKVKIVFDNGTEHVINYVADEKLHKQLLNVTKLFLIRVDKGKPVEGYDTTLIKEEG
jgi:hypothetical protein